MGEKRVNIRDACKQRLGLDGPDSEMLEYALTMTERERDDALEKIAGLHVRQEMLLERAERAEARVRELEALFHPLSRDCKNCNWYRSILAEAAGCDLTNPSDPINDKIFLALKTQNGGK